MFLLPIIPIILYCQTTLFLVRNKQDISEKYILLALYRPWKINWRFVDSDKNLSCISCIIKKNFHYQKIIIFRKNFHKMLLYDKHKFENARLSKWALLLSYPPPPLIEMKFLPETNLFEIIVYRFNIIREANCIFLKA